MPNHHRPSIHRCWQLSPHRTPYPRRTTIDAPPHLPDPSTPNHKDFCLFRHLNVPDPGIRLRHCGRLDRQEGEDRVKCYHWGSGSAGRNLHLVSQHSSPILACDEESRAAGCAVRVEVGVAGYMDISLAHSCTLTFSCNFPISPFVLVN